MDGSIDFLNEIPTEWYLNIKEFIRKYIPEPINVEFDIDALHC